MTTFLSSCLDPPDIETILRTLRFLRDIQALKPLPQAAGPSTTSQSFSSIPLAQLSRMSQRQRDRVIASAIEAGKAEVAGGSADKSAPVEEDNDVLTPLGHHLANFPLDPQCAKLLILGALFCCLQPALAVAACLAFKDPFEMPFGKEDLADKKRREFAEDSMSDHWAFYSALRVRISFFLHCLIIMCTDN